MSSNTITIAACKKIYFASDQHLGLPNYAESKAREIRFVQWLDTIKTDAQVIFLLGDLFDFWFEYYKSVPKYYVRTLGKLAELCDKGIRIIFFYGNHDMWMCNYLQQEIGIEVYPDSQDFYINNQLFKIGHGDGLGPGDETYKKLKKIFRSPFFQFCFRILHPDLGLYLGEYFSRKNKLISGEEDIHYLGDDKEWLVQYCQEILQKNNTYNYFIFGHRHLPLEIALNEHTTYFNTGDWIKYFSYLVMDNTQIKLAYYQ